MEKQSKQLKVWRAVGISAIVALVIVSTLLVVSTTRKNPVKNDLVGEDGMLFSESGINTDANPDSTSSSAPDWIRSDVRISYLGPAGTYTEEAAVFLFDGANGVIFTPWLHGNRCPFEDSGAGGMFFNIRIENGKKDMIRAVLEGICYHLRWLLECSERKVKTSDKIRFVGGGALSPLTCQMLADITGRTIETVDNSQ